MSQQPPWESHSRQDHFPAHVQQHVPPQFRQRQLAQMPPKAVRRRPPYPSHLTHFPAELTGLGGKRRGGRGPSIWRMVYLGTHPVALLMTMLFIVLGIEMWLLWLGLILTMWLAWVAVVTAAWGCQVAVGAMRSGHGRL